MHASWNKIFVNFYNYSAMFKMLIIKLQMWCIPVYQSLLIQPFDQQYMYLLKPFTGQVGLSPTKTFLGISICFLKRVKETLVTVLNYVTSLETF